MPKAENASRTLQSARQDFITAMNRDTAGNERPRLVAVPDALIAWSLARPQQLRLRASETRAGVVSFEQVKSKEVFWAAQPARGDAPRLALVPRAARVLSPEQRATAMETLNAHTRMADATAEHLRIGFGALKNADSRAAVLDMLDQLLPPAS